MWKSDQKKSPMRSFFHFPATLTATFFYIGRFPVAPGTAGSFLALVILYMLARFLEPFPFSMVLSGGILLMTSTGIPAASYIEKRDRIKDPSHVVIDEAIGQWLTFLFIPGNVIASVHWTPVAGFLLFRFFDIVKPWPARQAEKLAGGFGIVLDDIIAGAYACITVSLMVHFLV